MLKIMITICLLSSPPSAPTGCKDMELMFEGDEKEINIPYKCASWAMPKMAKWMLENQPLFRVHKFKCVTPDKAETEA